jgi:hypothetical protein
MATDQRGVLRELPEDIRSVEGHADGSQDGRPRSNRRWSARVLAAGSALAVVLVGAVVLVARDDESQPVTSESPSSSSGPYATPPARGYAAMASDPRSDRVVMFGGADENGSRADTWVWDGTGWVEQHPTVAPPARQGAAMGFDPDRGVTVLFGGADSAPGRRSKALTDTWEWDGAAWREQHPTHTPAWHSSLLMAYDSHSDAVMLLALPTEHPGFAPRPGGVSVGPDAETRFGTWLWRDGDWHEQPLGAAPRAVNPGLAFASPGLAADPATGDVVFFSYSQYTGSCPGAPGFPRAAGRDCEAPPPHDHTWRWDGNRWQLLSLNGAPDAGAQLVTDLGADTITAVDDLGRVWRLGESEWRLVDAERIDHFGGASVTYDHARDGIVGFGGFGPAPPGAPTATTWFHDGQTWERT